MNLAKFIAQAGLASRRKAAHLIKTGQITINHFPVTDPAYEVQKKDTVRFEKQVLKPIEYTYILINKPVGCISSNSDEFVRKTVFEYLEGVNVPNLHTVGRLDYNTSGIMILTNDGDLTEKLTHPKFGIEKTYRVTLDKPLEEKDLLKASRGVTLQDGLIKADKITMPYVRERKTVLVTIHSGKKNIIKRMFRHLGYFVDELDRTRFAGFSKKFLKSGSWRYLSPEEVAKISNIK